MIHANLIHDNPSTTRQQVIPSTTRQQVNPSTKRQRVIPSEPERQRGGDPNTKRRVPWAGLESGLMDSRLARGFRPEFRPALDAAKRHTGMGRPRSILYTIVFCLALGMPALAPAQDLSRVGVVEHLGEILPLDQLKFNDEDGNPVVLKDLFDRPVILTLVYFRCPGICTPLLQELVKNIDNCDLVPGVDYKIITISFDPAETAELAKPKKANMIGELKKKTMPPDAWRFLTGDEDNIRKITEAMGFLYTRDRNNTDFVHAATLMFLSKDGKIARYLNGTEFNPADIKMAVIDAAHGNARSFMQKIQRLCYAYDPEGRAYVLKINRVILGVTVAFAAVFGGFLVFMNPRKNKNKTDSTGTAS